MWLALAIKLKEFHSKKLAFLNNLNAIGLYYCLSNAWLLFLTTCDTHSEAVCSMQALNFIYMANLSGYGLAALALYRLTCVCIVDLATKLNRVNVTLSIALIWLIPFVMSLIQCFAFKAKFYFAQVVNACAIDSSESVWSFVYFALTNAVLPNLVVLTAYFVGHYKMRALKQRANAKKPVNPPRTTIQLLLYILMFELHCGANLILFYQVVLMRPIVPDHIVGLMRLFKWFHHFSPIALLYLHPLLIKQFRCLVSRNQSSIVSQRRGQNF
jgi:hypothetical protein